MSNQAQIDADAAMARRLQEQEFETAHHFQFGFRRPSSSSSSGPGERYFFQTTVGPSAPSRSSAADAARNGPGSGGDGGIPDRERTPYAFVRDESIAHPSGNAHMERMARATAQANAAHARAAHAHAQAAHEDNPLLNNMMFEHFSHLFHGAPPPPPRRFGSRDGRSSGGMPGPPHIIPDAMAEMMRHINSDMPSFFHGPPGTGTGMGGEGGASFFFNGGGADGGVPHFFRAMMGGAGGAGTYEEFLDMIERRGNVNRGAKDNEIANLRTEKFQPLKKASGSSAAGKAAGVDDAEKCVICLAEFEKDDVLISLPCEHRFHKDCVSKWLKVNRTCPSCKRSIRPDDSPQR